MDGVLVRGKEVTEGGREERGKKVTEGRNRGREGWIDGYFLGSGKLGY